MLNTVSLQGRFTKTPELKKTIKNSSVVAFTLAVEKEDKKIYIDCVAWYELAESIVRDFKKGQPCVIIGELNTRLIKNKDIYDNLQVYTKMEVEVNKIFFVKSKKDDVEYMQELDLYLN